MGLTLSRVQFQERVLLSEGAEKGRPVPNLTACSISGNSQARWIGLTGPADHSVLGSIQNAPDTSAKHYKEPADNKVHFSSQGLQNSRLWLKEQQQRKGQGAS